MGARKARMMRKADALFDHNPNIRGAITQKLIDIEKACVAYCKVCGHRKEIALPQDCRKDCLRFEAFLKAMKE